MLLDKNLLREKLQGWEKIMDEYALPNWDNLPTLPLYMDQVIYLLNEYLIIFPTEDPEERLVTPAMINNYVKLKIIPAPIKKRYGRLHLAYLILVCILKQSMNTGDIKKLLSIEMNEAEMQVIYTSFVGIFESAKRNCIAGVKESAKPILRDPETSVNNLIFQTALSANFFRMLTEQMIALQPEQTQNEADATDGKK